MARFWTCHWQFRFWRNDVNPEFEPVRHSAASGFKKRGVSPGDFAYIFSLSQGQLHFGGRMVVHQILDYEEAVRFLGRSNIWQADEHIVGEETYGTPLNLHRVLEPEISRRLRFISPNSDPKPLFFKTERQLDGQTTRGVRELMPESAALLDRIIEITDRLPRTGEIITVTESMLDDGQDATPEFQLPEEVCTSEYSEGNVQRVTINRYERDPGARKECIRHYGPICIVCGFDFAAFYGPFARGFTHVHHIKSIAEIGENYMVNPIADLRPVCPNCHAVIHLGGECRSIEEVKLLLSNEETSIQ